MKRVLVFFAACVLSYAATAQPHKEFSNFSIEVSTGCPSLPALLFLDNTHGVNWDPRHEGYYMRNEVCGQLNLALRYSMTKRWEFLLMGSVAATTYIRMTLPDQDPETGLWSGNAYRDGRGTSLADASVTAIARVNYGYFEKCHFYSALGLGIEFQCGDIRPAPLITPFGIMVGEKKRVYGTFELSAGTAGLGIIAGLGIRL